MLSVKINSCPYDERKLYKTSHIDLETGLNVIIGRNGSGKTTLCREIENFCNENKIPLFKYDNYTDGGSSSMEKYMFFGNFEAFGATAFHSEGEQIFYNFGEQIKAIGKFIREHLDSKQLVITLDAMDSGLDIDGIDQLKSIVNVMTEDCKNKEVELYVVATANNYALIHKNHCIDVSTGKDLYFEKFEDFHKFISDQYKKDRAKGKKKN